MTSAQTKTSVVLLSTLLREYDPLVGCDLACRWMGDQRIRLHMHRELFTTGDDGGPVEKSGGR